MSYCNTEESAEYPKYIDENGIKRCCLCKCRGPMYEPESTAIILAAIVNQNRRVVETRWLAPRTP